MAKTEVEAKILERLEAEAEQHAIDVVDVEVTGAGKQTVVTVRLDHADESAETITLDEVAAQTAWVSAAIDELDPFPGAYLLEISSPGIDRPLRKRGDYTRFTGEEVVVKLEKTAVASMGGRAVKRRGSRRTGCSKPSSQAHRAICWPGLPPP